MKIGIIDYGVGNLGSIVRALDELGANSTLIEKPSEAGKQDRLILPGVGNFTDCMRKLDDQHWTEVLSDDALQYRPPLLGICVGMQILADFGEEGASKEFGTRGLGLIPGRVVHMGNQGCSLRLPHVGWNDVYMKNKDTLFSGIPDGTDFYFTHSYSFIADNNSDVIAIAEYGTKVTAAVRRGNVWGTQFHPEKSSKAGFRLLKNFINGVQC